MLIRLLIFMVFGVMVYRTLKRWMGPGAARRKPLQGRPPVRVDDEMIKDPICGTYFPKRAAVIVQSHDRVIQFCSSQCREQYLKQQQEAV